MKHIAMSRFGWLLILACSLLPLTDLLHPGFPVTHDGQDHVVRIANFYQSLSEGNVVPRWAGNLNWGYGHPVLMFLYPLPSYVASLFHAAGFSFVDSTKLVFAVSFSASMLCMYWWVAAAWGVWPAIAASVLYGFAPYRFVDLYVRGAIGEHTAFVFLPVVLWGIYGMSGASPRRGAAAVSLGTAALILSHNALSLMFLPLIGLYACYVYLSGVRRNPLFLVKTALCIGIGFFMSAFFWIPAFFEGKYTLRDIVTAGQFDGRFVPWSRFFYSPWDYGGSSTLSKFLGWSQLAVIAGAASLWVLRKRCGHRGLIGGVLVLLFVTLLVMTDMSGWLWNHVSLLPKFQFPWRFLSVAVFVTALLGGLLTVASGKRKNAVSLGISILAIMGTTGMWHARTYAVYPQSFFTGIYHGTTDTGESSPIWSVRFMEREPVSAMSVIDGDARVTVTSRSTTRHAYEVVAAKQTLLVEQTLYFPGWSIVVDGKPAVLEYQDPNYRGLMTFTVSPGTHEVVVSFADTRVRRISTVISFMGAVLFLAVIGTIPLWRKKR